MDILSTIAIGGRTMRTMKRLHQIIVTVALTVTVATQLGHAETDNSTISFLDWKESKILRKVSEDEQLSRIINNFYNEQFVLSNTLNKTDIWPRPQGYNDPIENEKPDKREIDCLAHNIYYEAGHEPTEGKIAVGLVTLNRMADWKFPKTVCAVVRQRVQGTCQFSWNCMKMHSPNYKGKQWSDSVRIAHELLAGDDRYDVYKIKYANVMYFHHKKIRSNWSKKMTKINSPGHNVFYRGKL